MRKAALAVLVFVAQTFLSAHAQTGMSVPHLQQQVRAWRQAHEAEILREFFDLLSIPNVANDTPNIRRNADAIIKMLERRGVKARLLESPGGGPPAVYGELRAPRAAKTIVFYAHYDGQPVDPKEWRTDPWKPVIADGRIWARSASDDKAPIIGFMAALDALRSIGRAPGVNLKFYFEGEEEAGSAHLREDLTAHRELLTSDGWVFCDGPSHQSGRSQVVFGVRGTRSVTITTFGPNRQLHSGHYGNWAPNPIAALVQLLGSMRDDDGNAKIAGFLDDVTPPTAREREAIARIPHPDADLRRSLALGRSEANGAALAERILLPAINFTGIHSGSVGKDAVNAIRSEAQATIDFRLVPKQTPDRVRAVVEEHIRKQGFHIVHERPSDDVLRAHPRVAQLSWSSGYPASRTPLDHPLAQSILRAVEEARGEPPIASPTLGGSLPIYVFEEVLGAPVVIVPIANHDNNQHAANENIKLQNLWDGIEVYATLFVRLGSE